MFCKQVLEKQTFDCAERMLLLINAIGLVGIWRETLSTVYGNSQTQIAAYIRQMQYNKYAPFV